MRCARTDDCRLGIGKGRLADCGLAIAQAWRTLTMRVMSRVLPILMLLTVSVAGQEMRRQGGPPPYNPKAEVTANGTVIGTETITPPDRPEQTILLLTVDNAKLAVF